MLYRLLRSSSDVLREINGFLCRYLDFVLYALFFSIILFDHTAQFSSLYYLALSTVINCSLIFLLAVMVSFFLCNWLDIYLSSSYLEQPSNVEILSVKNSVKPDVRLQQLNEKHLLRQVVSNINTTHLLDSIDDDSTIVEKILAGLSEMARSGKYIDQSKDFIRLFTSFKQRYMNEDGEYKSIQDLRLTETTCPITLSKFPSDAIIVTTKFGNGISKYICSKEAMSQWAIRNSTCPMTRAPRYRCSTLTNSNTHTDYYSAVIDGVDSGKQLENEFMPTECNRVNLHEANTVVSTEVKI